MVCAGRREELPELISIYFSPWSLKVKWALRCSEVQVSYTEKPVLESPLCWRLGIKDGTEDSNAASSHDGKLTFPILVLPDGSLLRQSADIVKWAHGKAAPGKGLGGADPKTWNSKIDEWDVKANKLMMFARGLWFKVAMEDDARCVEMVRIYGLPLPSNYLKLKAGRYLASGLQAKYEQDSASVTLENCAEVLDELRSALTTQKSWSLFETTSLLAKEGPYLVDGRFSYADIVAVLALHTFRFFPHLPNGILKAIESPTTTELAARYEDLYKWAEAVLKAHLPALD